MKQKLHIFLFWVIPISLPLFLLGMLAYHIKDCLLMGWKCSEALDTETDE